MTSQRRASPPVQPKVLTIILVRHGQPTTPNSQPVRKNGQPPVRPSNYIKHPEKPHLSFSFPIFHFQASVKVLARRRPRRHRLFAVFEHLHRLSGLGYHFIIRVFYSGPRGLLFSLRSPGAHYHPTLRHLLPICYSPVVRLSYSGSSQHLLQTAVLARLAHSVPLRFQTIRELSDISNEMKGAVLTSRPSCQCKRSSEPRPPAGCGPPHPGTGG